MELASSASDSSGAGGPAGLFVLLVWVLATLAYFVPTIVSGIRRHPQTLPIFILNFLAGWTFVGWVAALVWACMNYENKAAT